MSPHLTEGENSSRGCIQACPYLPLQSEQVSLLMADESFYGDRRSSQLALLLGF